MKKKLLLTLTLGLILMTTLVSANNRNSGYTVIVAGKIYNQDFTKTIEGATVDVVCDDDSDTVISKNDGSYAVQFQITPEMINNPNENLTHCANGSSIWVYAEKDGAWGQQNGTVNINLPLEINVGVVNVPLIPEFGLLIGTLTIIGAVVVFFLIRKY